MRIKRAAEFARKGLQYSLQAIFSGTAEKRVQARRRIALASVYRFRKEITFRRDGFTWTGPSQSYVIRMLYVYGCNPQNVDLQSQESLGKWIIGDRPFLVNVGANIGDTALPLSRIGKKILAIEPSPESFAYLQKNVIQNDLEGAIIVSVDRWTSRRRLS